MAENEGIEVRANEQTNEIHLHLLFQHKNSSRSLFKFDMMRMFEWEWAKIMKWNREILAPRLYSAFTWNDESVKIMSVLRSSNMSVIVPVLLSC